MYYAPSILMKSVDTSSPSDEVRLWEDEIFLIVASDETEARLKAMELGKDAEHEYANNEGRVIRWVFDCVQNVYEIGEQQPTSGTEIFSRFLKPSEVESIKASFEAK